MQEAAGVADTGGREAGGEKELRREVEVEAEVDVLAAAAARDLGLELGKTIKLEWHK